jgi:hypothetical protein
VWHGDDVGTADGDAPGSYVSLSASPTSTAVSRGWAHAFVRQPLEEVASAGPDGVVRRWRFDRMREELFPELTSGRWAVVCHLPQPGMKSCRAHDQQGQFPELRFEAASPLRRHLAFIGGGTALLIERDTGLSRVQLQSGASEQLLPGGGTLYPLGDAEAVIYLLGREAWLVEADHLEKLGEQVSQVMTAGASSRPWLPAQTRVAVLVRTRAVEDHSLDVLSLERRALVTVSDRLFFAPHLDPLQFDDIGQPWVARPAGFAHEQGLVDASTFFFAEQPRALGKWTVWVAPLDLSAPPRKLLEDHYAYVHAPRVSEDGRVAIGVDGWNGVSLEVVTASLR